MPKRYGLSALTLAVAILLADPLAHAQPVPPGGRPAGAPAVQPPPPPPPPPPPGGTPGIALTEPMWVSVNGQATGPFEPRVIAEKIARREIIGETLVFTQSMNRWVRAADVAALQPLLQMAQGGTPAGPPGIPQPPPQPPPGSHEQIQRLTMFMVGEWLVEVPGHYPGITVRTQTRYFADGTYRGFQATTAAGGMGVPPNTITRPHNGRWSVQPIDDRRFTLSLTGAQMAGAVALEIIDPNRLRNEMDNYIAIRIGR